MALHVAINHRTKYTYDRLISLSPHEVRLKPAPHCRTPIKSYSLRVTPENYFLNWQQDPFGNYVARLAFPEKTKEFSVEVDLVADMISINPFDFFIASYAEEFPFTYESQKKELLPYLETETVGPKLLALIDSISLEKKQTNDFLVEVNRTIHSAVNYSIRMEPGIQSCEETLTLKTGSCRDSAWLLVQVLRNLGLAARFVSGYLIQLTPDLKSLDGPSGSEYDFTDLHAWTEVYLPGAGWIGLDPTSGLLAGEGHIPLACSPSPSSAAAITGAHEFAETEFHFDMKISRVYESPRVTKPYSTEQWQAIEEMGETVDAALEKSDVRLTMGGEPTFVSIDDMEGDEWNTAAVGPNKRKLSYELMNRLKDKFCTGGLLHLGQGKWYPGEQLPRWAFSCIWRRDQQPIWKNPELYALEDESYNFNIDDAQRFVNKLSERLQVNAGHVCSAYEDVWYYLWREGKLPVNVDPFKSKLDDQLERNRLAKVFEAGLDSSVGYVLPITADSDTSFGWRSGKWSFRQERMYLIPGDSPLGLRLPLESLPWLAEEDQQQQVQVDPFVKRSPFEPSVTYTEKFSSVPVAAVDENGTAQHFQNQYTQFEPAPENSDSYQSDYSEDTNAVRTALCVEVREGRLFVFMPPLENADHYLELVAAIESCAEELNTPITLEGYSPPHDPRLNHFKITPDPGVIEVNIHPAENWKELVHNTTTIYDEARACRLGTDKFDLDGRHRGTGGGNHVVMGGKTPDESPFLRRPDLLRSLIGYWHNHPSLSYLFSGAFIGPTSQAPRVDEGRVDSTYELQLAFDQIPDKEETPCQPWLVDRIFRNLLVDLTGNTHRSEFCIDKLFSPDSSSGRLGLVEFRGFEMPPHSQMSLTQQLLLRTLVAWFWEHPYKQPLVEWGTTLHDRFMLPHYVQRDLEDIIFDVNSAGFDLKSEWFDPHFEFRFQTIGEATHRDINLNLRQAIEPWYVLGEEQGAGGTARYVDSSVERLQLKVNGFTENRYQITCNGHVVPLHSTGKSGEFVAGVRYRAWQPPHCLHPTVPVDSPLVFDIFDSWGNRSLGGCTYHIVHPGGRSHETFPINALEAEGRRISRFSAEGHSVGDLSPPPIIPNQKYPLTLDLRKSVSRK